MAMDVKRKKSPRIDERGPDVSGSFWENIHGHGEPRNRDEVKEKALVDALFASIRGDDDTVRVFVALLAHLNTRIWRLRTFLDRLSDETPFRDGCPLMPGQSCPLLVREGGENDNISG